MKFILTREVGRLVRWLRILGFDTRYFKEDKAASLIIEALRDDRVIVTRNHRLPEARGIKVVLLKTEKIKEQICEFFTGVGIAYDPRRMFTRCIICNDELIPIDKPRVKNLVPEYVYNTQKNFTTCPHCKKIYWQGTHWGNVVKILEDIKQ